MGGDVALALTPLVTIDGVKVEIGGVLCEDDLAGLAEHVHFENRPWSHVLDVVDHDHDGAGE